jgi:hypothetical protein
MFNFKTQMTMSNSKKRTESATLERYRVALENVEKQPEIASIMAEFGYDAAMIEEGKNLFTLTRQAYDENMQEDDETSEAYDDFSDKRHQLEDTYSLHRKKAKVLFRKNLETLERLDLDGSLPRAYIPWLETVQKFYSEVRADNELQTKLQRLRVTPEELTQASTLINELKAARAKYLMEKGESQDATTEKDARFNELDDWMREFYAVARIAMEDNIQLMEALGVVVRNY